MKKASAESTGESPEGAASNRKVTGEMEPIYKNWHEVPASEHAWIAAASTNEIVERYHLGGKDPERLARGWKKYAKEVA